MNINCSNKFEGKVSGMVTQTIKDNIFIKIKLNKE